MSNLTVASLTGPSSQKGAVKLSNPIVFLAKPVNTYESGSMPTGVIPMTALLDPSNSFNSTTNAFVAPVDGVYRATWGGLQMPSTVTSLMVNGIRTYQGNHYVNGANYQTMTQTALVPLLKDGTLQIEGWNGGGYYKEWYLWSVEYVG